MNLFDFFHLRGRKEEIVKTGPGQEQSWWWGRGGGGGDERRAQRHRTALSDSKRPSVRLAQPQHPTASGTDKGTHVGRGLGCRAHCTRPTTTSLTDSRRRVANRRHPPCVTHRPSAVSSRGPWTVTRSSLRRVRRVVVVRSAVGPLRVAAFVCAWGPVFWSAAAAAGVTGVVLCAIGAFHGGKRHPESPPPPPRTDRSRFDGPLSCSLGPALWARPPSWDAGCRGHGASSPYHADSMVRSKGGGGGGQGANI